MSKEKKNCSTSLKKSGHLYLGIETWVKNLNLVYTTVCTEKTWTLAALQSKGGQSFHSACPWILWDLDWECAGICHSPVALAAGTFRYQSGLFFWNSVVLQESLISHFVFLFEDSSSVYHLTYLLSEYLLLDRDGHSGELICSSPIHLFVHFAPTCSRSYAPCLQNQSPGAIRSFLCIWWRSSWKEWAILWFCYSQHTN